MQILERREEDNIMQYIKIRELNNIRSKIIELNNEKIQIQRELNIAISR